MNDYLGRLAHRALAPAPAVRPRLASPFEPLAGAAVTASAELDPRPPSESRSAQPAGTDSPGAVRNDHDQNVPNETALHRSAATASVGSELAPSTTPTLLPATGNTGVSPARGPAAPRNVGRAGETPALPVTVLSEGNARPKRPTSPQPDARAAGGENVQADRRFQPPLDSTTGNHGTAPRDGSLVPPIPTAPTAAFDKSGPLTAPAGAPKPDTAAPPAASRVIHPHVRLPGPTTAAADAGRAASPPVPAAAVASVPPDVHITIGRVEIRAVTPPAAPRASSRPAPRVSLDDYLKQTAGGRR